MEGGATFDSSLVTKSVYNSQGALIASSTLTLLMEVGSTNWAYVFEAADGSCVIRTGGAALPTSAALGQSGAYLSGPKYGGCNPTELPRSFWISTETLNQTWTYKTIGGIPFVCIDSALSGSVGTATESNCIEVADATGALGARLRVTITDLNGVTTTLSN